MARRYTRRVSFLLTLSESCPILVGTKYPELKFLLDKPKFTVGRINSCYNIKDDTVDRHHCTFTLKDDTWTLHNFSITGTSINGTPLNCNESKPLFDKDVIQFGPGIRYTFMFHADRKEYEQGIKEKPNENASTTEKAYYNALTDLSAAKRKIIDLEHKVRDTKRRFNALEKLSEHKDHDRIKRLKALDETVKTLQANIDNKDKLLEEATASNDNKDKVEELTTKLKDVKKSLRVHRTEHTKLKEDADYLAETIEAELMCTICNELMYNVYSVNCGHMFCKYCLTEWKRKSNVCPLCRVVILSDNPAVAVNSLLSKIFPKLPEKMKAARRRIIEERGGEESDLDALKILQVVDLTEEDNVQNNVPNGNGQANNPAVCAAPLVDLTQGNDFVQLNVLADIEID